MVSEKYCSEPLPSPVEEPPTPLQAKSRLVLAPSEWASLSRFGCGEWIPEAQVDRLHALGLVEKVFGQALLTRLGRTTLGLAG